MRKAIIFCAVLSASVFSLHKISCAAPGDIAGSFLSHTHSPSGLAYDGRNLWLADSRTDSLYTIDPQTGLVVATMLAPSINTYGIACDGAYLWLVDGSSNQLIKCDNRTCGEINSFPSPVPDPSGIAWDGNNLWLAGKSTIYCISIIDGAIIKSFAAPGDQTTGLAFDGQYLWSADRICARIYMISCETGDVLMIFPSPAHCPWGLAFAGNKLYNVDSQTDSLYQIMIDTKSFVTRTHPLSENMNYHDEIRNEGPGTLKELDIYLAIPQNSYHQALEHELVYSSSAKPEFVKDKWGQPYAEFHFDSVPSGGVAKASYQVTAEMYETRYFIRPEMTYGADSFSREISHKFLEDDTNYDINNSVIQNAVKSAIGEETNQYWKARKIYHWIIDHLSYELDGGWYAAPKVIENGKGSCSEYTFVFIAMCRAAGIPARYDGAIALRGDRTSKDNVFHRWCEIYLPPYGWIPVDPSGGDTPSPEGQANNFGCVSNSYLVTTSGAGSDLIGWDYNSGEKWQSAGKSKIDSERVGEWSPADKKVASSITNIPDGRQGKPLQ